MMLEGQAGAAARLRDTIRIGTSAAPVGFAGLISPGLYQFNLTIPNLPDGDHPVTAQVGDARTIRIGRLRIQRQAAARVRRSRPFDAEQFMKLVTS